MKKEAFTLIELLVVIVIIGTLATISVSTFRGYIEKARLAKAQAAYSQTKNIFLSQAALLEEDNIFTLWYSFDENNSVNQTNPYLVDKSNNKVNSNYANGGGSFSQNEDSPIPLGYSLQTNSKITGIHPSIPNGPTDKITIAFWFKLNKDDNSFTRPVSIANSMGFQHYRASKKLRFYMNNSSDGIYSSEKIVKDRWYYVVGSYGDETMRFWIDGELVGIKENVTQTRPFKGGGYPFYVGYNNYMAYFDGFIDEVMVFPYAFDGKRFY